jgi:cytochrome-b5 reductase
MVAMADAARDFAAQLLRLEPRTAALAALALAALAALAALLALRAARARAAPQLTREFQRFTVSERVVANPANAARPVIFLTLRVSTASLPTGAHVKLRAPAGPGGAAVVRSYTPTRFRRGECELMFRVYEGGPMTQHLHGLRVGDSVEMMGPTGLERYGLAGPGTFARGTSHEWAGISHVGLIAGGTGVTPMLQIANHVLQDPRDATRLSLLCFTTTPDDIILEEALRALAARSAGQLRLTFVASHASEAELRARPGLRCASMRALDAAALEEMLGVPRGPHSMVCVCGPDGFSRQAKALLSESFENVLVW